MSQYTPSNATTSKANIEEIKLLCVDWDETITDKHMSPWLRPVSKHYTAHQIFNHSYSATDQLSSSMMPHTNNTESLEAVGKDILLLLNHKEQIKYLIKLSSEKGVKVAIVTHSVHPDLIFHLLGKIGVEEDILNSMVAIYSGNPRNDKNAHLKTAREFFGIEDPTKVLFVDDKMDILAPAASVGYCCITAMKDKKWIDEVIRRLTKTPNIPDTAQSKKTKEEILKLNDELVTQYLEPEAPKASKSSFTFSFQDFLPMQNVKAKQKPTLTKTVSAPTVLEFTLEETTAGKDHTKVIGISDDESTDIA